MDNQGSNTSPDDRHDARHEPMNINIPGVLIASFGLVVLVLAVVAGMAALQASLAQRAPRAGEEAGVGEPSELPLSGPRLDPNQPRELAAMRAEERVILEGYGWVDRTGGLARIPIDRAIRLLAEKGLPVPTPAAEQPSQAMEKPKPGGGNQTKEQP